MRKFFGYAPMRELKVADGSWCRQGILMWRRNLLFIFVWLGAMGMSCTTAQYLPPLTYSVEPAVLKGKITGFAETAGKGDGKDGCAVFPVWDGSVRIAYTMQYSSGTGDARRSHTVHTDADGTFRLELPLGMPHFCRITVGETVFSCFVVPGDTVEFRLDGRKQARRGLDKALRFSGALRRFNRDYAYACSQGIDPDARFLNIQQQVNMQQPIAGFQGTDEDSYFRWLAALRDTVDRRINKAHRLHPLYREYAKAKSAVWTASMMGLCLRVLNHVKTDDDYYAFQERMRLRYENFLKVDSLSNPLLCYASLLLVDWTARHIAFYTGRDIRLPEGLKKAQMADRFLGQVVGDRLPLSSEQMDTVRNGIPELAESVLEVNEKLLREVAVVTENRLSEVCTFPTGAQAESDPLAALIAPYRGKPLVLDIWETTCGPCRLALKNLHELKKELAGNVYFVDVAGEPVEGEWNGSPLKVWEELTTNAIGHHYYLTAAQGRVLRKQLGVSAIPVFLLIDAEGRIQKRIDGLPDAGELRAQIRAMLK